jgi:hypothetical protein
MKPDTRRAVEVLLKDETLASATVWADQIKSNSEFDWARPLHYANVQPGAEEFDLERDYPKKGCVVSAIFRYTGVLRDQDAATAEKLEALKFIAHFVGDIHQPLHVSHARDRGGNDIKIFFFRDNTNLHRVWDSGMIRHTRKRWSDYAEYLNGSITPQQLEQWQSTDPLLWATESYKLAVSNAYKVPSSGALGQVYFDRNIPVVEERLKMGGVRLAVLLNDMFSIDRGYV